MSTASSSARRALRLHLELPNRFDLVAEELEPDRQVGRGREHVEDAAAHRVLAGGAHHVDARVAEPVQPRERRFPISRLAAPQPERRVFEDAPRHDVLAQRGHRRDDHLRLARAHVGEQRHPRAALRRRLERAQRLVARPQQRDGLGGPLAQVVRQVGEGALRHVGRRHHHEDLAAQDVVQRGEQVRPRRAGRLVEGESVSAPRRQRRAQPLDQLGERTRRGGQGANEARRENGVRHGIPSLPWLALLAVY